MISGRKVILREKSTVDAWNDYAWETDPELSHLDAVSPITITFSQYLAEYAEELSYCPPSSRRFAIDTLDSKHIGNCSYYNVSESRGEAELGIMIGNRNYWDKGYGTDVVTTLVNHIFRETNIKRIYLKTLQSNSRAQKCFQKCGFTPYRHWDKDGFSFMLMEIHRNQWREEEAVKTAGSKEENNPPPLKTTG
ncbi:MAG: GNAT family N-acetyltransferase [Chloroflexi bacterium]|nr:GNAT family N-acetyltransferase [Chloroflexota bacterium]